MARLPAVLEEKYEFEFDVGQWTYGTISVYKHRASDKLRTCKTVPKQLVRSSGSELPHLKHLRQLAHSHICSVTDALEDRQYYYIFTEYLQGGELSDWAERLYDNYVIQEQTCAAYMRQALIATVHAHSFQVHHGALLPSSLSLSSKMPDAYVKISDFGLASILDPDNTVLQRNRSPYTAPEILTGEYAFVDSSSDMYSIGAITHALLIGRAPGANQQEAGLFSFSRSRPNDLEAAWSERSKLSRDFVQKLISPWDERLTPAQALQHPWLKDVQPIISNMKQEDTAKDIRHKMLCHSLAIMLVPVTLPFRDFEQLQQAFMQTDKDEDGLIPRQHARTILRQRCPLKEAVDAALAIADIH
jgi:serine/threonine protein kinase